MAKCSTPCLIRFSCESLSDHADDAAYYTCAKVEQNKGGGSCEGEDWRSHESQGDHVDQEVVQAVVRYARSEHRPPSTLCHVSIAREEVFGEKNVGSWIGEFVQGFGGIEP